MDRWIEEWCSYNSAAGILHTKKFVADFFRQKLKFTGKIAKSHFVSPFGGLRGNVHLWLIEKCVIDFLLVLIELFFASSHGWGAMSKYWLKLCCLKGGGSLWVHFRGKGSSTNKFWRQKTRVPGLSCGVVCMIICLAVLIQYRHVTQRHTDRHTMMAITRTSL